MTPLSVIILTRDEERHLRRALESIRPLEAHVWVVDSGSTDGTLCVAREFGCALASHPWTSYAQQFEWALDNLPWGDAWVMRLDADERLTPELAQELQAALAHAPADVNGFRLKRRYYFWGRWIRHGGMYPVWVVRIWRRGSGRIEARHMDEHMVVAGNIASLRHDIIDENDKGLSFWTRKHDGYSDREVRDLLALPTETIAVSGQARRRRWLKKNLYARSPRFLRAFAYWLLRYVVLLGFLDGRPGLVFHFLQGFWYRFLVDAKADEAERAERSRSRLLRSAEARHS